MTPWTAPLTAKGTPCQRCRQGNLCPAHEGRQGGQPPVYDDDTANAFLNAIRTGAGEYASARIAGWHPDTFRQWKRKYEDGGPIVKDRAINRAMTTFFGERLPKAKEYRRMKALTTLTKSMEHPDGRIALDASKFVLTHYHGDEMTRPQDRVEHSGEVAHRDVTVLREAFQRARDGDE